MTQQWQIDTRTFAQQGEMLSGEFPLATLTRLRDILASDVGGVRFRLIGKLDPNRQALIECIIEVELQLTCQRCLTPFAFPLKLKSRFVPVRDASELPAIEEEGDEADYLVADPHTDVRALIEEEILLALPIAPMHRPEACKARVDEQKLGDKANPFAALAALKKH
jgi:uncharacterized protein